MTVVAALASTRKASRRARASPSEPAALELSWRAHCM